jgi:hypothetical protein
MPGRMVGVNRLRPLAALIADAVALVAFVLIGVRSHTGALPASDLVKNLLPLIAAWAGVASVVATYRRPGLRTLLITWAVAVPIGLAVRTWWVGSFDRFPAFLAVGMVFTLLFLVGGRSLAALGTADPRPDAPGPSGVVR